MRPMTRGRSGKSGGGRTRPRAQKASLDRREFGGGSGFGGQRGKPGFLPGGLPPVTDGRQPDYFGQLNAFQADIGGEQPGPIQAGWGGAGGDLGTMGMTKVNSWLNTFTDPVQRAQAMNGIGYFNAGNPYTPEAPRGMNQFHRGNARENQETGGFSAPGTYLHQSGGYGAAPGVAPDMNFGGYIGATTIGDDMSGSYQAFDRNRLGGRIRRRGGTTGARY